MRRVPDPARAALAGPGCEAGHDGRGTGIGAALTAFPQQESSVNTGGGAINASVVRDGEGLVRMAGATLAVQGPGIGVPHSFSARLRMRHPLFAQLLRYAVVGGLGTVLNAVIFLVLRTWWDAMPANLAALVLSTVVGTEVNRRFTFDDAPPHPLRAHLQTVGTVVFYALYSSAVLVLLAMVVESPTAVEQSVAIAAASLLGGLARFLVLRDWVFRDDEHDPHAAPSDGGAPEGHRPA